MLSFHIHDGVSGREEVVGKEERLVHIAAGVVADVEDEVIHSLFQQLHGSLVALLVGGAGELAQANVPHARTNHKGSVHTVHGNLAAGYFKGNDIVAALDGNGDLAAGRAFDVAHHAVLRELHTGYHQVVHFEQTVSGLQTHLLGGTAGNDFQHNGGVVGHVELDADSVKIAGQGLLGSLQFHGRQIHGMRVQLGQGCRNGSLRHAVLVQRVHIILLHQIENEIELLPVLHFGSVQVLFFAVAHHGERDHGTYYHAQYYLKNAESSLILHNYCICSTSMPALARRSIPSVRR